jgi:ADP-heptose:LPS heptosyltransferase
MAADSVIGLRLGIGELAALIKNCDEYIGYDSAGQHMAAALNVPCTTIFAGSNSMRFVQRWAALGPGERHIVHVDTITDPTTVDIDDVISRIMAARGSA